MEMETNGAIKVMYSVTTISFSSSPVLVMTDFVNCVIRLMNTHAHQFHQSGPLEMLQIE